MEILLAFKGRTEKVALAAEDTTDAIFEKAREVFSLQDQNLKILAKGKALATGAPLSSTSLTAGAKAMVMATGARAVAEVLEAKSDPTVRGFASEDALAKKHAEESDSRSETSVWGATPPPTDYRFCRFEACTWQSFGVRAGASTPHAFEARALLLKLAHDPAIRQIMAEREWTVGLLAELDPIDDRLAEKMEGGGKRLLGYNTNAGAQIHLRLRTEDLSGFLPYPSLIDTLLHELSHNEVGPHNEQFWHLFCQLKADYLRYIRASASRGEVFAGKSALQLSGTAAEVSDVRGSVLQALERDRQMPVGELQPRLLDAYLAASNAITPSQERALGAGDGAATDGSGTASAMSREERRALFAARASARQGVANEAARADAARATTVALKVEGSGDGEGESRAVDVADHTEESMDQSE